MPRILLIDDDAQLGEPLAAYFGRFGFALEQASGRAKVSRGCAKAASMP